MFGQKLACGDDVEELEELLDEKSLAFIGNPRRAILR
jgi:hypothetical protein